MQAHKRFDDDCDRSSSIVKYSSAPIAGAEAAHLLQDGVTRYVPLPYFLDELLAADRAPIDSVRFELALDDDLRRNAGMIGALAATAC